MEIRRTDLKNLIERFEPFDDEERVWKEHFLNSLSENASLYRDDNEKEHITVSAWVVAPKKNKVLMAYHNIYQSFAWLGGHLEKGEDLYTAVLREVEEESGLKGKLLSEEIFSIECLPVKAHIRRGELIQEHIHLNLTFLIEANPEEKLVVNEDENKALKWLTFEEVLRESKEPWMCEHVYKKLNNRLIDITN